MAVNVALPADLEQQLEAELAALKGLEGVDGVAPDYLRFCGEIARFQATGRAAVRASRSETTSAATDTTMDATKAARAPPATRRLPRGSITLDRRLLRELLAELEAVAAAGQAGADHLNRIAAATEQNEALLEELVTATAFGEDARPLQTVVRRTGMSARMLALLGRMLASPFMAEARHSRGALDEVDSRDRASLQAVRCPTCGSTPSLAILLREDGRRRLWCALCDDTWIGPRLVCAICGNDNPSRLGTLQEYELAPRCAETCDACRHYIKTVDLRRLPQDHVLMPRAEEAATLHLDLMAEEAGYVRPLF
jgi:formate dehydrogenase accessory protein FdhE